MKENVRSPLFAVTVLLQCQNKKSKHILKITVTFRLYCVAGRA